MDPYQSKYLKYKEKYLALKKEIYGGETQDDSETDNNQDVKLEQKDEIQATTQAEKQQSNDKFADQLNYFQQQINIFDTLKKKKYDEDFAFSQNAKYAESQKNNLDTLFEMNEKAIMKGENAVRIAKANNPQVNLDNVIESIYQRQEEQLQKNIVDLRKAITSNTDAAGTQKLAKAQEDLRISRENFAEFKVNSITSKTQEIEKIIQGKGGFTPIKKAAISKFLIDYMDQAKRELDNSRKHSLRN